MKSCDNTAKLKESIDFLKIYDGNRLYYGGTQEWFKNSTLKKVGCSIVAAANIIGYMSLEMKDSRLYNYKDSNKENFLTLMESISKFISPDDTKGVTSIEYFAEKVIDFAKSRGIFLKSNIITIDDGFQKGRSFVKRALNQDKPIGLLMLKNRMLKEFEWHWMTVTKLFENNDKTYLDFSTWGERRIFTLEDFYNYSSFGALIYFDRIN